MAGGMWRTINGAKVFIGEDGKPRYASMAGSGQIDVNVEDKFQDPTIELRKNIDMITHSKVCSQLPQDVRDLFIKQLSVAGRDNIAIVAKSINNLTLDADGDSCYYSPGGSITMNFNQGSIESMRIFWHEYGHYVDDIRNGNNGLKMSMSNDDGSYKWDSLGCSEIADRLYKYDVNAGIPDVQNFLDDVSPGKYDVRGEDYPAIYLKGTETMVGVEWGKDDADFADLLDNVDNGLKRELGYISSEEYYAMHGAPQRPDMSDYYVEYRTEKRQTLKTKPAYKGADIDYQKANKQYFDERDIWEKANPKVYSDYDNLYWEYKSKSCRVGSITDTLDGMAKGEMGMNALWGGHSSSYFKRGKSGIEEGWADYFSITMTNDVDMQRLSKKLIPNAKRIFELCHKELIKQTLGR